LKTAHANIFGGKLMLRLISTSAEDTLNIGERLGKLLDRGDIICLSGDLGAGKTALTQGIANGMGVKDYVTSPTYTIINEYQGRIPLYHFDVYRLNDVEEMYELGYEEYFFGDGAVVVEWADIVKDIIPGERLWITILQSKNENSREIILEPTGEAYEEIVKGIEQHESTGS
jgi:tRNA threonylcarbamoyladenosine biosynthesis protein TsaE